ncbi:ewing's tumor-associated antigen 1 [Acanthopagrus schlegelii]
MNGGFRRFDRPPGVTGSPLQTQATPSKPNRLSRSFRRSQQARTAAEVDSPRSHQPDFKTPTRIPRSRSGGVFSGESPHNDSDFQQDIIWDATSPSPSRRGKRGKKQRPGVVDISEIVSRIAPKHGRPEVAEPTLQQWIGDSATIPCTPDVQGPKPKKKSPRPNGVDDLLKLAKQFDFNMFHQDEEDVEELHQQSLELLPEDILDLENNFSPSLPGNCERAVKAAAGTNVQVQPDQHMEDDLDFLFDGPTQRVSGNLSQVASQVKPASSSHGSTQTNTKATVANDFEDDWENDDLLDDSLVLEMTQNPQMFAAPKHSSTQKPSREGPVHAPVRGLGQSHKVKDDVRQRTTFKLESNPNFSVRRLQTNKSKVDYSSDTNQKDSQQSKSASVSAGSQRSWQTPSTVKSEPQKPQFHPRASVSGSGTKHGTSASNTSDVKTGQNFPQRPAAVSSHSGELAAADLLDDDLLAFFSEDPVWDDPADDDLLCEMCEDVENQLQNVPAKQTLPVVHVSNQRAALQPANQQHFPQKQAATAHTWASGAAAGRSPAAGFVSDFTAGAQTKDSFRVPQTKTGSGCVPGSSRVQSAPPGHAHKDRFTFKKPNDPLQTATSKVVGKCSAAEIELKKQQAMERRRHRLQAAQNLRAPT